MTLINGKIYISKGKDNSQELEITLNVNCIPESNVLKF